MAIAINKYKPEEWPPFLTLSLFCWSGAIARGCGWRAVGWVAYLAGGREE